MEKQQILKEKFDKERQFITNILKKCTKNTYVETLAEQGPVSGNERTYVSHHVLPSGLHVYWPTKVLDRVAEHREFDKPFDDRDTSATYYILTDEIKDLKRDPKGIYLFRGKQAGIEYTKSLGEEKIIYGVDSYIRRDGISLIRDWKVQAALRDISGYHKLGGYKRDLAYSAYVIQRGDCMRDINNPEDEMTRSLRELIEESKLSEDIKLAYLTEIEKLSAMLEKERKALSNEDNSEKETAIGSEFADYADEYLRGIVGDEGIEGDGNEPTGEIGAEFAEYGDMDLTDDENINEEERRRLMRETIKNLKKLGIKEDTIIENLKELRVIKQNIEKKGPDQR